MRSRRFSGLCVSSLGALALVSCGGGGEGSSGPPRQAPVASVDVLPTTMSLIVGHNQQALATPRDASGNELSGRTLTWTTNASDVATVAPAGSSTATVTAVKVGSATITVSVEGKSATVSVGVSEAPTTVSFASVAAGGAHSCGLTATGAAYCWGRGESGQLGVPAPTTTCQTDAGARPCSTTPVAVGVAFGFVQLALGGAHTCGLTSDGSAYCWGSNSYGQLGDNSTTNRSTPVAVAGGLTFASIDAGAGHTCALTNAGRAYCWGQNDRGQVGDGSTTPRSAPVLVATDIAFEKIAAGGFEIGHSCALTGAGALYCWGDNERGQLGIGAADATEHPWPTRVTGGITFASVSAGLGRHTCGLTSAGAAYCWGENSFGALGDGTTNDRPAPVAVSGGLAFAKLVAGGYIGHSCGLTAAGAAYCWGDNEIGAVGDGTNEDRLVPAAVAGGLTFVGLDAGFRHNCARASTGVVYCWGSNGAGQLGDGSNTASNVPVRVARQL